MRQPGPCAKCGGAMTRDITVDHTHSAYGALKWHPGEIVRSFWTGVKVNRKSTLDVIAHRCSRCGFLELHAPGGQA